MMLVRTRVASSRIHGLGLFAVETIPCGTPIWRFEAGFDHAFAPRQVATLPPPACEHTRWFSFVSRENGQVILSGDHACFMNHSAHPNTGVPPGVRQPVTTVALRDIVAGEEITCNYFEFDGEANLKLSVEPVTARPDA